MKRIGINAVIIPVKSMCHEACKENSFLHRQLIKQLLRNPPASAAIIIGGRLNLEEIRPKCMIRVDVVRLASTSNPMLMNCFALEFMLLPLFQSLCIPIEVFHLVIGDAGANNIVRVQYQKLP